MVATSNKSISSQLSFIPSFIGENYDFWCVKMKTLFMFQDVCDFFSKKIALSQPKNATTLTPNENK